MGAAEGLNSAYKFESILFLEKSQNRNVNAFHDVYTVHFTMSGCAGLSQKYNDYEVCGVSVCNYIHSIGYVKNLGHRRVMLHKKFCQRYSCTNITVPSHIT